MAISKVAIRIAVPADVDAVRELLVATWHDTYDPLLGSAKVTEITNSWHSVENLTRQIAMPDTSFLVAEERGAIVGHSHANAQKPPLLVLSRLYVRPDRQRRGIGTALLAAAVARHPAMERIRLEVEADNAKGLSFYRRSGFSAVGEGNVQGIDHIAMERPIDAAIRQHRA